MSIMTLETIDPTTIDPDDDIWVDRCMCCGSLDNHGDLVCGDCE